MPISIPNVMYANQKKWHFKYPLNYVSWFGMQSKFFKSRRKPLRLKTVKSNMLNTKKNNL